MAALGRGGGAICGGGGEIIRVVGGTSMREISGVVLACGVSGGRYGESDGGSIDLWEWFEEPDSR